jgi:hypothetical protein
MWVSTTKLGQGFATSLFFYELAYIVDGMVVRVPGHSGNKKTKKVKRNKMKI